MLRNHKKKQNIKTEVENRHPELQEELTETPDTGKIVTEEGIPVSAETELQQKFAELNEKYLRLLAEYDNFRKRTAREIDSILQRGSDKLVTELLPILDNLDRATEHRNDKTTYEEYVKGIALIEDQFRAVLSRAGLEPIEVVGKPFDPNLHDALLQVESNDYESGIISAEAEKGYMLGGRVLRHSKVIVSK